VILVVHMTVIQLMAHMVNTLEHFLVVHMMVIQLMVHMVNTLEHFLVVHTTVIQLMVVHTLGIRDDPLGIHNANIFPYDTRISHSNT
jgi:hypothetical protein